MAFHEEMQVRRYTTCLEREQDPNQRKRFERIIARWHRRAIETKLPSVIVPPLRVRPYSKKEVKARGLDEWRINPEKTIADLRARVRVLEQAVDQLQLARLRKK